MCMSSFGEANLDFLFCVSYNLLTTFACNLRRFTFCLAIVGITFDSYLWKKKRKDVKEIMTKQGTTVKYIDLINRFI